MQLIQHGAETPSREKLGRHLRAVQGCAYFYPLKMTCSNRFKQRLHSGNTPPSGTSGSVYSQVPGRIKDSFQKDFHSIIFKRKKHPPQRYCCNGGKNPLNVFFFPPSHLWRNYVIKNSVEFFKFS